MQVATARRRRLLFALLYFNEGAPIGLIWLALPALLRAQGVPVARIGTLLALVVLPWTFKFLAGPLVDRLATLPGASRILLLATLAGMAATLTGAAGLSISEPLAPLQAVLLAHACCAALNDVSIDALAIRVVPEAERGRVNAAMQVGLYAGRSFAAGLALGLVTVIGWRETCLILAGVQVATLASLAAIAWPETAACSEHGRAPVWRALRSVARRRDTWFGLLFAAVAGAGYEATAGLAGPWLIDSGVTLPTIGRWQALGVPAMIVAGSIAGGVLADRRGHHATAAAGIVGFTALIGVLALAARWHGDLSWGLGTWPALAGMYFAVGVFTVGSYALLMDLTDRRLGGTQFSAYMAATNFCEAWAIAAGSSLAAGWGYAASTGLLAVVSLASLLLLPALAGRRTTAPAATN